MTSFHLTGDSNAICCIWAHFSMLITLSSPALDIFVSYSAHLYIVSNKSCSPQNLLYHKFINFTDNSKVYDEKVPQKRPTVMSLFFDSTVCSRVTAEHRQSA